MAFFNHLLVSHRTWNFVKTRASFSNGCCCPCGFLLWKLTYEMGLGAVWLLPYRMPIRLTCCCIWSSETPLGPTTWLETWFLLNWHTGHQERICRENISTEVKTYSVANWEDLYWPALPPWPTTISQTKEGHRTFIVCWMLQFSS